MNFKSDHDQLKPLAAFSHSSLTDIVLLLLIFFLLTSSFVANHGIKVNIPKAESSVENKSAELSVTITSDGNFYVAERQVSSTQLASAIQEEKQKRGDSTTLVVRADKEAIVDDAIRVMNIAQALNLRIVMATEPGFRP